MWKMGIKLSVDPPLLPLTHMHPHFQYLIGWLQVVVWFIYIKIQGLCHHAYVRTVDI